VACGGKFTVSEKGYMTMAPVNRDGETEKAEKTEMTEMTEMAEMTKNAERIGEERRREAKEEEEHTRRDGEKDHDASWRRGRGEPRLLMRRAEEQTRTHQEGAKARRSADAFSSCAHCARSNSSTRACSAPAMDHGEAAFRRSARWPASSTTRGRGERDAPERYTGVAGSAKR
jgi:hypothetical protein